MGLFDSPKVLTLLVVQMWWIAIWGLSYITIDGIWRLHWAYSFGHTNYSIKSPNY